MADSYDLTDLTDAETVRSSKSGTPTVYLTEALGLTETRATLRRLPPGASMPYHRHAEQEELYVLLDGKGAIVVDGERLTAGPGTAVRVSPGTPRQLVNDSAGTSEWLVVGAPPAEDDGTVIGPGPAGGD